MVGDDASEEVCQETYTGSTYTVNNCRSLIIIMLSFMGLGAISASILGCTLVRVIRREPLILQTNL